MTDKAYYLYMKTLKLDNSYKPIGIVDPINAFSMVRGEKASVLEYYDKGMICGNHQEKIPAVIVLKRYVNYQFFRIVPTRKNIYERDNYQCQYCMHEYNYLKLTLDHVVPKSKGGTRGWSNMVSCCRKCNQKKGNKMPKDIGMMPNTPPVKPRYSLTDYLGPNIPKPWMSYLAGHKTN
jgi:hypothetical protein